MPPESEDCTRQKSMALAEFGEVLDLHQQLGSQLHRYRSSEVLAVPYSWTSRQDLFEDGMNGHIYEEWCKSHSSFCMGKRLSFLTLRRESSSARTRGGPISTDVSSSQTCF
ncbi:uncharacterized protein PADG_12167 [Paracoccidioides brasiliensis Pb18]|uniref:Uncharacterized protein n=1 Tax=Paracoccidioides brasiliensis (strain Pb18) TaxID=502780 RepID=A0A0A0HRA1_PARBD|nr:uncharacterized protein PADG_12167 [Paracoccidioides brasiliensis Pb18]KGM91709.1 hypothetical protein PADG_12167 [Paracoccidioides brasiliensis Pb18]